MDGIGPLVVPPKPALTPNFHFLSATGYEVFFEQCFLISDVTVKQVATGRQSIPVVIRFVFISDNIRGSLSCFFNRDLKQSCHSGILLQQLSDFSSTFSERCLQIASPARYDDGRFSGEMPNVPVCANYSSISKLTR